MILPVTVPSSPLSMSVTVLVGPISIPVTVLSSPLNMSDTVQVGPIKIPVTVPSSPLSMSVTVLVSPMSIPVSVVWALLSQRTMFHHWTIPAPFMLIRDRHSNIYARGTNNWCQQSHLLISLPASPCKKARLQSSGEWCM